MTKCWTIKEAAAIRERIESVRRTHAEGVLAQIKRRRQMAFEVAMALVTVIVVALVLL